MALINASDSAHDFIVKLSPCLCSHSSGEKAAICLQTELPTSGEDLATYAL